MPEESIDHIDFEDLNKRAISKPIVSHLYTADPSAHVFGDKIYIYPSHDIDTGDAFDDLGSHFAMEDYHVFSMNNINDSVTDHGMALHVDDVKWAERQMWAPDANEKDGKFYLFFPAKDYDGIPEDQRTDQSKIPGCTSQAWVIAEKRNDNYFFICDSDALIVKGLLSLLCKIFSGQKSREILSVSHSDILNSVGLSGLITVQRTNGFASAVKKIHEMSTQ